jgi:hypothetical protein
MSGLGFLRTRQWLWGRRIALIAIIAILAFRNYGGGIYSWLRGTTAEGDVVITKTEFRPDLRDGKPAWIIRLKNQSKTITYTKVELEATYSDQTGKVLEKDKMVLRQRLIPGDEQVVASSDFKARPGATAGTLKVLSASR